MTNRLACLLSLMCVVGGCGDDRAAGMPLADGGGVDGSPNPGTVLNAQGGYAVVSPIDLTALALASEREAQTIALLKGLRDDPAGTFFAALEEAGVPLAADLYDVLPSVLKGKVQGWINQALLGGKLDGRPIAGEVDQLLAMVEQTLIRFDLLTDLQLPGPGDAGAAGPLAGHLIRGVRYDFLGGRLPVIVPRLIDKHSLVNAETEMTAAITSPAPASDGALVLGDHAFGLPYGEYALAALNQVTHQRYGAPLRPALGRLFDCPGMGQAVAKECAGPLCVGHAAELTEICERGLDHVVEDIQERIQSLNFNAVRFRRGQAALWDQRGGEARDGQADRIADGTWEAFIDLGQGPRPVTASFSGLRQ
jgi:hypothetical protein